MVARTVGGLASGVVLLAGCALMDHGTTQVVHIDSAPGGARAVVQPGGAEVVTPGDVVLPRKSSYAVRIAREGYQPTSVALVSTSSGGLWRNLVWIQPLGWLAGILTDVLTGAAYELKPARVDVTLVPTYTASAGR
jgi:hypothetical protein